MAQSCRPLELDTDGIWCCLPGSFPEEYTFKVTGGKPVKINYPGLILNVICAEHNTNSQFHTLVKQPDGSATYEISSQMSIEFEVDGPYLVRSTVAVVEAMPSLQAPAPERECVPFNIMCMDALRSYQLCVPFMKLLLQASSCACL
jgi:hypothetical protein